MDIHVYKCEELECNVTPIFSLCLHSATLHSQPDHVGFSVWLLLCLDNTLDRLWYNWNVYIKLVVNFSSSYIFVA